MLLLRIYGSILGQKVAIWSNLTLHVPHYIVEKIEFQLVLDIEYKPTTLMADKPQYHLIFNFHT